MRSAPSVVRRSCRLVLAVLPLVLASPRHGIADDTPRAARIADVPRECTLVWSVASGPATPAANDAMLSFAACIQDASVYRIERAEQIPRVIERLRDGLDPAFKFYMALFEVAPEHVQLRVAYAVALAQTSLMTRARRSLAAPALREELEAYLEPHAKLAYLVFTAIERTVTAHPELAADPVNRYIVRSSRELAAALRACWRWGEVPDDDSAGGWTMPSPGAPQPRARSTR